MTTLAAILIGFSLTLLVFGGFLRVLGSSTLEPAPGASDALKQQAVTVKRDLRRMGPWMFKLGIVLGAIAAVLLIIVVI
jgi:hypothetical protein